MSVILLVEELSTGDLFKLLQLGLLFQHAFLVVAEQSVFVLRQVLHQLDEATHRKFAELHSAFVIEVKFFEDLRQPLAHFLIMRVQFVCQIFVLLLCLLCLHFQF